MDILICTTNRDKLKELSGILRGAGFRGRVLSLSDVGLSGVDVEENASTLLGNALKKAKEYYAAAGGRYVCIADDSGLFVDALDGDPGVFSARYAGDHDDVKNNAKLLDALKGLVGSERSAQLRTVLVLWDGTQSYSGLGVHSGIISEYEDISGFAYDRVFIPDGSGKLLSRYTVEQKNEISHRGRAMRALLSVYSL